MPTVDDIITESIFTHLERIESKLDAMAEPINEFAALVVALKTNPMMAQFLNMQQRKGNGNA